MLEQAVSIMSLGTVSGGPAMMTIDEIRSLRDLYIERSKEKNYDKNERTTDARIALVLDAVLQED